MTKIDVLKYDRRVDDEFLKHFLQGGVAESLLDTPPRATRSTSSSERR